MLVSGACSKMNQLYIHVSFLNRPEVNINGRATKRRGRQKDSVLGIAGVSFKSLKRCHEPTNIKGWLYEKENHSLHDPKAVLCHSTPQPSSCFTMPRSVSWLQSGLAPGTWWPLHPTGGPALEDAPLYFPDSNVGIGIWLLETIWGPTMATWG